MSGLVIGRKYGCDEGMREEFVQVVGEQCFGTRFPILMNIAVGNTDPILTVPLDAMMRLDSGNDALSILEAGAI